VFPLELRLGPFAINAHGVMTAAGIWAGWLLARREARRKGLDQTFLDNLALAVVFGGLVGARLSFVLFEGLDELLRDPWAALRIWQGGLGLQGGILGGLAVGLWYCRRHGMAPGPYADAIAPGLLLGQALGRLGDFLVGGEYGTPTTVPWAVTFTDPRAQAPLGVALHPAQLYEMGWDLAVLGLLWRRRADTLYPGALFVRYAFLYSLGRFVIEYVRADALAYSVFGRPFPVAKTLSLLTMLGCLVVHARLRNRPGTPRSGAMRWGRRATLVILLVALAGCAGAPVERAAEPLPAGGQAITISLSGFAFRPDVVAVTPSVPLTITAASESSLPHDITVLAPDGSVVKRVDVPPGQTAAFEVTLGLPGRYVFYCSKLFHRRPFGMDGILVAR
jgi:phosphatidylglycerol:prolipoprotein diacylglycerol transferase